MQEVLPSQPRPSQGATTDAALLANKGREINYHALIPTPPPHKIVRRERDAERRSRVVSAPCFVFRRYEIEISARRTDILIELLLVLLSPSR